MRVEEVEIYVTKDGYGRAAIVRRSDGRFCIYKHLRASGNWMDDDNPALLRYDDPDPAQIARPLIGVYGTVADARKELRSMPGYSDAELKQMEGDVG
jgi:hypothetical protein